MGNMEDSTTRCRRFPRWMHSPAFLGKVAAAYRKTCPDIRGINPVDVVRVVAALRDADEIDATTHAVDAQTAGEEKLINVKVAGFQDGWRCVLGARLAAVITFTGVPDYVFAERILKLRDTKKKQSPSLCRLLQGEKGTFRVRQARDIADQCHLDPNWFLWGRIDIPEPLRPSTRQRLFSHPPDLLDAVRETIWQDVIMGTMHLRDIGIETGAPAWVDPFIGYTFTQGVPRRHLFTELHKRLRRVGEALASSRSE